MDVEQAGQNGTAVVAPHVEDYCWAASGWEDAGEGSVQDARTTTRGQAAAFFARCAYEDITEVRVWKRYVRSFTRQEVWDEPGRDRWVNREEQRLGDHGVGSLDDLYELAPVVVPDGWQPDEYDPSWQFVRRDHPDAIPVWVCGFKGDEAP